MSKKTKSLKDAIKEEIAKEGPKPSNPPDNLTPPQSVDIADQEFMPSYSDMSAGAFPGSRGAGPGMPPRLGAMPPRGATGNRVLDELLANIPANDGYYLKLYKEVSPNEFEFKWRFDHWENWSDLEWEITYFVKEHTKKSPKRWGSGRYRIVPFREGGMRGPMKFKPNDFLIDAGEAEEIRDQGGDMNTSLQVSETIKSQLEAFKTMADLFKGNSGDPNQVPNLIAESMQKGMDLSAAKENANATVKAAEITAGNSSMNQLIGMMGGWINSQQNKPQDSGSKEVMSLMIQNMNELMKMQLTKPADTGIQTQIQTLSTVMVEMMKMQMNKPADNSMEKFLILAKEMGMFDKPKKEDPIDLLIKLKQAGLIPDHNKAESTEDQIGRFTGFLDKIKPVAELITGVGSVEKPSAFIEIAKVAAAPIAKAVGEGFSLWRNHQELEKAKIVQSMANKQTVQVEPTEQVYERPEPRPPQIRQFQTTPKDPVIVYPPGSDPTAIDYDSIGNGPGNRDVGIDPNMLHAPSVGYDPNMEVPMRPPDPIVQPRIVTPRPVTPTPQTTGGEMFPQVKALKDAIATRNSGFFPELRELLISLANEEDFDKLLAGEITIQSIVNSPQVQFLTGPWVTSPQAMQYFEVFVNWARDAKNQEFYARCNDCNSTIIYNSKEDFSKDPNCESCGNPMTESQIKQ